MSRAQFIVAAVNGRWLVSSSQGFRKYYDKRVDALREAVECADRSGREGHQAQVLALDENDQLYPIWTYGQDAFVKAE